MKKGQVFLRPGPKLGFVLVPTDIKRHPLGPGDFSVSWRDLSLGASYLYYFQTIGSDGDAALFDTYLQWNISGSKNISFKVDFQDGKTPILLKRVNLLTVGLGLRF